MILEILSLDVIHNLFSDDGIIEVSHYCEIWTEASVNFISIKRSKILSIEENLFSTWILKVWRPF